MLTDGQRLAVRIGTLLAVGLSLSWPAVMHVPEELPTVALGSEWLLYFERAGLMMLLSLLLLVALVRGAWQGVLPSTFTKDGIGWSRDYAEATEAAQATLDRHRAEIDELARQVRALVELMLAATRARV